MPILLNSVTAHSGDGGRFHIDKTLVSYFYFIRSQSVNIIRCFYDWLKHKRSRHVMRAVKTTVSEFLINIHKKHENIISH